MTIPLAHDFTCPWCWIGFLQVQELRREFEGLEIEWMGYELMPEELPWDPAPAVPEVKTNRPKTPTRMDLAWAAQGIEKPSAVRPKQMRTHNALEAVEYAKTEGRADEMVEKLYRALWEEGKEINDLSVLRELAAGTVSDVDEMVRAIEGRRFEDQIVPFDDGAYAMGIYNVPTFWIGGERYAEQPIRVLRRALKEALGVA